MQTIVECISRSSGSCDTYMISLSDSHHTREPDNKPMWSAALFDPGADEMARDNKRYTAV